MNCQLLRLVYWTLAVISPGGDVIVPPLTEMATIWVTFAVIALVWDVVVRTTEPVN